MKPLILLCNDDSISSPFLPHFSKVLSEIADVQIAVPAREQSWIGRAFSRHSQVSVERKDFCGFECFAISGTPADCVNIAVSHLCERRPDMVVSGMNIGHNVALPNIWCSGTFSAAVEGAGFGILSAAFSMRIAKEFYEACRIKHTCVPEGMREHFEEACAHAKNFVKNMLEVGGSPICEDGRLLIKNVNYPEKFTKNSEVKKTVLTRAPQTSLFKKEGDGVYKFSYSIGKTQAPEGELGDWECVTSGMASVSDVYV